MNRAALLVLLTVAGCSGAVGTSVEMTDASPAGHDASVTSTDASGTKTDASTSSTSATGEPDGALIWSGPLPACHWPSNILPPVPDGGLALGSVSRTVLFCGAIPFNGGASASEWCPSDNGAGCSSGGGGAYPASDEPCVMACEATQYAVLTADPFDFGPMSPSMDADVIDPRPPAGCTGVLSAFAKATGRIGFAEAPPSVQCCPCE
jgi:hypothetical protein